MIELVEGARGTLEGSITEVKWRDPRDGRLVADLELADSRHFTVVGVLADAEVGDELTLAGAIERDERFGLQFRIEAPIDPQADAEAALHYLASGLVAHIGPAAASTIVDVYGAQTMARISADPDLLLAFRGITPARLPKVRRSLRASVHLAPVVGLLDPFSISTTVCKRIWRRYRAEGPNLIRANPWRLANEIFGVGFRTADRVARGLGAALDDPKRIEAGVLQTARDAASEEGHIVVMENILAANAAALTQQTPDLAREAIARLVVSNELVVTDQPAGYALPRLAAAEGLIASKLRAIASFADASPLTVSEGEIDQVAINEGIVFDASQRQAIKGALEEHVTVITGSPGTGKTTIVRAILDLAERRGMSTALVSPTGRAAKRLEELVGRKAYTIHRWLRYHPDTGFAGPAELPDLLVVDEASMLDSPLAARLLSPLLPYTRLLLVGDIDQLPAIGPGNVLSDLIASPLVNVFRLITIHRTEKGSGVPVLARAIRDGERHPAYDRVSTRFIERETPAEIAEWITGAIAKHAAKAEEIQVLAPMKKGAAGTDALNRAIQAVLNPPLTGQPVLKREGFELRPGDRILATGNDYDNDLYNGDIFYLRAINPDRTLKIEIDGVTRLLPSDAGGGFSLAYAMTVHKAQGSEFPIVLIPMHPSFYLLLERRLLYTAVARARRTVAIVGQTKAVSMAIGRHDPLRRQTLLRGYLKGSDVPSTLTDIAGVINEEDLF